MHIGKTAQLVSSAKHAAEISANVIRELEGAYGVMWEKEGLVEKQQWSAFNLDMDSSLKITPNLITAYVRTQYFMSVITFNLQSSPNIWGMCVD